MIRAFNGIEICFETNEIIVMTENHSNTRTKVEPRIMHVLKILMNNSPRVVSREQLIAEVWNNYGGADDALNQAISHLRKLLNDTNKEDRIIETVVKKGYRFIGGDTIVLGDRRKSSNLTNNMRLWIIIASIIMLVATFMVYYSTTKNSNVPIAPEDKKTNVVTPAPEID
ncbi:helix-turn-helix domain-containing protein [uncultured Winogradskyella sp.]|uniref:winged helix-turn-helix domain-containing protein n=1 Tax=uncultured Winogradskyella sp. TaxID=395353 RepID=UPI00261AC1CC|nr:helix-turn-helix domain-containing protein [uncultured Winogradskyella sp.]